MKKFAVCLAWLVGAAAMVVWLVGGTIYAQTKNYTVRIVASGDTGGNGIYSYGNHKVDDLDHFLTAEDNVTIYTPDGKSGPLKWNENYGVFTTDLQIQTTKFDSGDITFAIYRSSRDPVCLKANSLCKDEPVYGIYAETLNADNSVKCTVELRHYTNVQFDGKPQMYIGTGIYGLYDNGCAINWNHNRIFIP